MRAAYRRHGGAIVEAVAMYALTVSDVRQQSLAERINRILHPTEDMVITTAKRI